jgi:hypothetical protein
MKYAPPGKVNMKIRILKEFIGNVEGNSVPFGIDQEVDLPIEAALDFVKGGYAETINERKTKRVLPTSETPPEPPIMKSGLTNKSLRERK